MSIAFSCARDMSLAGATLESSRVSHLTALWQWGKEKKYICCSCQRVNFPGWSFVLMFPIINVFFFFATKVNFFFFLLYPFYLPFSSLLFILLFFHLSFILPLPLFISVYPLPLSTYYLFYAIHFTQISIVSFSSPLSTSFIVVLFRSSLPYLLERENEATHKLDDNPELSRKKVKIDLPKPKIPPRPANHFYV